MLWKFGKRETCQKSVSMSLDEFRTARKQMSRYAEVMGSNIEGAHHLVRTSAVGEEFVGMCLHCGKLNLTYQDSNKRCDDSVE